MRASYLVHVVAGTLSLVAGYVALYSVKGATLHRRAGTVFVYAMLAMCVAGFTMAVGRGVAPAVNVPAALLTAYLVVTSLASVRPPALRGRWLDFGALVVALGVAGADVVFAGQAFANGGSRDGTASPAPNWTSPWRG